MESYITERKQYVKIDDTDCEGLPLKTGVHQGSILGQLFFIIYKNDIVRASNIFDIIIYADDTTLSTTLEVVLRNTQTLDTESKLNSELANVSNQLKLNKLKLNVQRCKYIILHMPNQHVNALYLVIDGAVSDRVFNFHFLGLRLDENLNWKGHINKISKKISKSMGI